MELGLRGERVEPFEFRVPNADGTVHWLYRQSDFVRDDQGGPVSYIATYLDITERKAGEARRHELEEQLQQSQKMEAVGQLTGGLAHDFNNLLMVIMGNLELIEERVGDDEALRRLITAATEAGQSGADLIQHLLAFSRRQTLAPQSTNLNTRIVKFLPLIGRSLGEAIELRQKLAASVWPVMVDPGQFDNAILNLTVNARDAMPNGGSIEIATENVTADPAYAAQHIGLAVGDYVRVSVTDSGHGMSPEVLARVFEPFFTTKESGKGTGLGLSMVYGFIKQSGGNVTIYSEVGDGTVVRLLLPRAAQSADAAEEARGRELAEGSGEKILVVEDERKVRAVTVAFLQGLGYQTLDTGTAREALILLQAHHDIELLLTDVVLAGGESGPKLAEQAKRERPSLKVLFASGYTEDALTRNGQLDPSVLLLRKPYTKSALATKVREALERPADTSGSDHG